MTAVVVIRHTVVVVAVVIVSISTAACVRIVYLEMWGAYRLQS